MSSSLQNIGFHQNIVDRHTKRETKNLKIYIISIPNTFDLAINPQTKTQRETSSENGQISMSFRPKESITFSLPSNPNDTNKSHKTNHPKNDKKSLQKQQWSTPYDLHWNRINFWFNSTDTLDIRARDERLRQNINNRNHSKFRNILENLRKRSKSRKSHKVHEIFKEFTKCHQNLKRFSKNLQ